MGRKKITIQKIEQKKDRLITFCKRRLGLLKKAAEISILCDVHVFLAFTDLNGGVFQFDSFRDSDTSNRKRDMESTLEKIKVGNFVTYDLSQYPFDELKQQQPTQADAEREEGVKVNSEIGYLKAGAGQDSLSEAGQVKYYNSTSISQIKSSLDRVLNTSSNFPGSTKVLDEMHLRSHAVQYQDFGEALSYPQQPQTHFSDMITFEPMKPDKYGKKVEHMSASLENCRTEQSLWSFIQSKGEEHEPLQIDSERLKRIKGRLRRDFLFECSKFKISQTRNDQDINELVILYYFIEKYLDLSLNGACFELGSFAARILGICSGSIMQALAGSFSFGDALSQEAKGRTKVLAEYFLRRFLDPSFHQYSPPNYMLVNCMCNSMMNYLQSINLFLALNGSKSLGSTSFMVDQEQLGHIENMLDLTLRIILTKETAPREVRLAPSSPLPQRHQDTRSPPSLQLKKEDHCISCHLQDRRPQTAFEEPMPPLQTKESPQATNQQLEPPSGGARIFGGAAGVFGSQKLKPKLL